MAHVPGVLVPISVGGVEDPVHPTAPTAGSYWIELYYYLCTLVKLSTR